MGFKPDGNVEFPPDNNHAVLFEGIIFNANQLIQPPLVAGLPQTYMLATLVAWQPASAGQMLDVGVHCAVQKAAPSGPRTQGPLVQSLACWQTAP